MKILIIGGTGTISTAISRLLIGQGHELYLLNRNNRGSALPSGFTELACDARDEEAVRNTLGKLRFDAVADFIAFTEEDVKRDYRLFSGRTEQYVFISSASAYQKPLSDYRITEGTPLSNPYWQYSRDKIACEEFLIRKYREDGFPVTVVRPSHTYSERSVPLGVHGSNGSWQVLKRMLEGRAVIIHGDGSSLWTLTHSDDFARAFVGLLGNIHAIGEAVQITGDESLTWNQIYGIVASALGVPLKAVHIASELLASSKKYDFRGSLIGDKANTIVFDNAKLKRLVPDFTAYIRADQGIRDTVNYILAHSECQKPDPEFDRWCDEVLENYQSVRID